MTDWLDTVVCGDCLDVMRDMPDGCVDLSIVDPPYNNGTQYVNYDDKRDDYSGWCSTWFAELRRVSRRIIVTPGHGNLWMWGEIEKPIGVGCWYKPGNPASSILGWVTWEPWLYYANGNPMLGGPDTIRATVSKQQGVGSHPCPKPLPLFEQMIAKASKAGQLIFDPFIGSGTTAVAAIKTGRHFYGCDISQEYVDIARKRIEQARQEQAQLELF